MSSRLCVRSGTRCLALVLSGLLAGQLLAQESPKPALNIVIVEGDGAINNIKQRTAREPVVQVEDQNHKPVAGASVIFLLPESGPSGTFAGQHTLTVFTDSNGRAAARGLRPNNTAGNFQIQVRATFQGMTGQATIAQTNTLAAAAAAGGAISGKLIAILAIAGAAAAGGVVAATRGGEKPKPTVSISPGTPTVGGPH